MTSPPQSHVTLQVLVLLLVLGMREVLPQSLVTDVQVNPNGNGGTTTRPTPAPQPVSQLVLSATQSGSVWNPALTDTTSPEYAAKVAEIESIVPASLRNNPLVTLTYIFEEVGGIVAGRRRRRQAPVGEVGFTVEVSFAETAQATESELSEYVLQVEDLMSANNFMIGPYQTQAVNFDYSEPFRVNSNNGVFTPTDTGCAVFDKVTYCVNSICVLDSSDNPSCQCPEEYSGPRCDQPASVPVSAGVIVAGVTAGVLLLIVFTLLGIYASGQCRRPPPLPQPDANPFSLKARWFGLRRPVTPGVYRDYGQHPHMSNLRAPVRLTQPYPLPPPPIPPPRPPPPLFGLRAKYNGSRYGAIAQWDQRNFGRLSLGLE